MESKQATSAKDASAKRRLATSRSSTGVDMTMTCDATCSGSCKQAPSSSAAAAIFLCSSGLGRKGGEQLTGQGFTNRPRGHAGVHNTHLCTRPYLHVPSYGRAINNDNDRYGFLSVGTQKLNKLLGGFQTGTAQV